MNSASFRTGDQRSDHQMRELGQDDRDMSIPIISFDNICVVC